MTAFIQLKFLLYKSFSILEHEITLDCGLFDRVAHLHYMTGILPHIKVFSLNLYMQSYINFWAVTIESHSDEFVNASLYFLATAATEKTLHMELI